ncbi:calcium-binding protein [Ciceribacter sp. L1K22]|uniref:calcium-binding protein n=1 Tax=Ciceribacter sp. L1K22 TaxID=2820275 RepID=UPI001ABE1595|nr:calcium-binding protein [Ciceribacter sp. L1K22]MBO3758835.1 calcium-binding protein [Ciceribacter sp. L1K22]
MTKTKLIIAGIAASLAVGTSAVAFAAPEGNGPMKGQARAAMFVHMLQQADTDKNGQISRDEANAAVDRLFVAIDADKDGSLTPGELRKHRQAMMQDWREERDEWRAQRQDDRAERRQQRREEHAGRHGEGKDGGPRWGWNRSEDGPRHGWRGEHGPQQAAGKGHGGPGPMGGRMMRQADVDENGQISKPEALAMADKMFVRMDRNDDGVISADDFPKNPGWLR